MIKVATAINNFASEVEQTDFVQPEEQIFVLSSSQFENLLTTIRNQESRISKLEENLTILHSLISKNKRPGPTTAERAGKIKEIMFRRQSISFAELRGILRCNKDSLRKAIRLFLEENEGYGLIENSDRRSSLLVKIRR